MSYTVRVPYAQSPSLSVASVHKSTCRQLGTEKEEKSSDPSRDFFNNR